MRRVGWVGLVLSLAVLGAASSASAQKRVALVIGNGTYTKVARLDNPKHDAAAMEAMFKAAAFTSVVRLEDLGVTAMKRALRDFSDTAQDADIAAVFYAGHGIEVAGVNYLIPIDAVLERDIDVQDEAVSLDRINQVLEGATMAFAHRGGAALTLLLLLLGGPASAQQVWSVLVDIGLPGTWATSCNAEASTSNWVLNGKSLCDQRFTVDCQLRIRAPQQ